jgi:hypothetical protein
MSQPQSRLIPIYSSQGEAEAYLVFPFLYNRSGEWVGWVTSQREVYSVMGYYIGSLTDDPRIVRSRGEDYSLKSRLKPPPSPGRLAIPATTRLAPMMKDLTHSLVDVFLEEPEKLHTVDSGEFREDMD